MLRYIAVRLLQGIATVAALVSLVFVLTRLIGSPVDVLLPSDATEQEREELVHTLGLDQPLYVQYGKYVSATLRGDLGQSLRQSAPVLDLYLQRLPNTARLAAAAMVFALVFGIALGVLSATHKGSVIDHVSATLSVVGMSTPSFWMGLMLMLILSSRLHLLPVAGMASPQSYVLPAVTLGLFTMAGVARLARSSMIEVLNSDFVKLARMKGASNRRVIWKHCLRNALLPILTFAGVHLANLLSGSVVVESIFAWPGVGRLVYQGIVSRDYPLVQGCLVIIGLTVVLINLLVDISYAYVDPRVRLTGTNR